MICMPRTNGSLPSSILTMYFLCVRWRLSRIHLHQIVEKWPKRGTERSILVVIWLKAKTWVELCPELLYWPLKCVLAATLVTPQTQCAPSARRPVKTAQTHQPRVQYIFRAKGRTHSREFCVIAASIKLREETSAACLMPRSAGEWVCCVFTTANKLQACSL